jgi:hypothetical protein
MTRIRSKKRNIEKQQLVFKIGITDSPILLKLIPEIKASKLFPFQEATISQWLIVFNAVIQNNLWRNTITNALMNLETKDDALVYNVMVDRHRIN